MTYGGPNSEVEISLNSSLLQINTLADFASAVKNITQSSDVTCDLGQGLGRALSLFIGPEDRLKN